MPLGYVIIYVKNIQDTIAFYENAFGLYGPCQIEVPYKGIIGIFLEEFLSPFYLFQVYKKYFIIGGKCYPLDA